MTAKKKAKDKATEKDTAKAAGPQEGTQPRTSPQGFTPEEHEQAIADRRARLGRKE